jgi:hypothetical protein
LLRKGEKDLDDLGVELFPGAADEPPIAKLWRNLSHGVKSEQA